MGADDDADCVEHIWDLTELHVGTGPLHRAHACQRCGAPRYNAGQATAAARPPLD